MRSSRLFRNNKRICWLRLRCSKRVNNWCNRFSRSVQYDAAYCRRYPDGASGWNNRPSGGMKRPLALCADPQVRGFENLLWNVGKNGCVTYRFNNGEMAFCDEGERLTFGRKEVSDD